MITQFSDITKNLEIDCDVCVIGSGAGGAPLAKELAEAGRKVVIIEEGSHYSTKDFNVNDTVISTSRLYRDAGATVIFGKPNVMLAEGRCLGGSTTINGGMCWRTPEKIMKRWQWERGLQDFTPEKMDKFFSRVEKTIKANPILPEARNRDSELLKMGAEALGYKVKANIRAQDKCVGANQCLTGCPTEAKQSMLSGYIPQFLAAGGDIFTNCRVKRVLTRGKRAVGIEGVFVDPMTKRSTHRLRVQAKTVVVSGGAIQTPALLLRSGIRDEAGLLGRNLLVHPNAKVLAVFEEPVNAWHGVNQGFQITEFFDEGIIMAVNFTPPGIVALALPIEGTQTLRTMKNEFHNLIMGAALIEDTGSGRVRAGPFDTVIPTYQLNDHDFRQTIRAVALLCEVFFAAGAKKCYLPFSTFTEIRSVDDIPKIYNHQFRKIDLELMTVHIMGTAQMGSNPSNSVINQFGEFHNVKGLFVSDASVFPTSIGVNPQITIMALATRTAAYMVDNFGNYL